MVPTDSSVMTSELTDDRQSGSDLGSCCMCSDERRYNRF